MKKILTVCIVVCVFAFSSCQNTDNPSQGKISESQDEPIFPKGQKITNNNFVGTAWLEGLLAADSLNHIAVGNVVSNQEQGQTGTRILMDKF